jgi:glycosyltransferase involved in cell wall biosynthesis
VRIAQVVPRGEQPCSGVLTVIVHLSAALARRGHEVEVWQLHEWEPDGYPDQRAVLRSGGAVEIPVAVGAPVRRLGREVGSLAAQREIDLVHLHGAFNPSNTSVARGLRHPYVFSPHSGYDPVSLQRSRGRKLLYRLLFERAMLDRAALIVGLTDVELGQIRAFGAQGPVEVIPNGVAPPPGDIDRLSFRRRLGIGADVGLALFVGRLDVHRKGLDLVAEGIAKAPGWHLALTGPRFRDVPRLEGMIRELGIEGRVHLTGERHGRELQEALAGADLFVLMSRWEGLPMALLETMSYGTPAIVSPAVARVLNVEEAGAGWVAPGDALGPLLARLNRDEAELRGRSAGARGLAGRFDWVSVGEQYEAAYARVLGSWEALT